jgi:hypothetical protein
MKYAPTCGLLTMIPEFVAVNLLAQLPFGMAKLGLPIEKSPTSLM